MTTRGALTSATGGSGPRARRRASMVRILAGRSARNRQQRGEQPEQPEGAATRHHLIIDDLAAKRVSTGGWQWLARASARARRESRPRSLGLRLLKLDVLALESPGHASRTPVVVGVLLLEIVC